MAKISGYILYGYQKQCLAAKAHRILSVIFNYIVACKNSNWIEIWNFDKNI